MLKDFNWEVVVQCCTYNQSKYICDALNGFTMQVTRFPFVCAIIDDASTDGEQVVLTHYMEEFFNLDNNGVAFIKETDYAKIIFAQHKVNKNCYFIVFLLKENLYLKKLGYKRLEYLKQWNIVADYKALCEGDDYWIDPFKLQKQVEFLKTHNEFSLCGSNGLIIWENLVNPPRYFNHFKECREISLKEIAGHWVFPTASLVYRSNIMDSYPEWTKKIYSGDQTLILISAYKGAVYNFSDLTCVYRQSYQNFYSASAMVRQRGAGFVQKQHLILYEEYLKYTGDKYKEILESVIANLKQEIRFIDLRSKNILLAFLVMPVYCARKCINKIKHTFLVNHK